MRVFGFLLCFVMCVLKVSSMALRGPPITKYDPCSTGVIGCNKFSDNIWQCTVDLQKYPHGGKEIDIQINFERNVTIFTYYNQPATSNNYEFKIHSINSTLYSFFVQLENNDPSNVPSIKKFSLNQRVFCDDNVKALQTIESLNVTQDGRHYTHVCGRRALKHAELNSIRTESKAGDWPWHVAIFFRIDYYNQNHTRYVCGGSIISRTAILTAGHCVKEFGRLVPPNKIIILAGVDNYKDVDQVGRQELMAERVFVHPNYNDREATADLAVIQVRPLRFTEYVQPICLWGPVYDKTSLFGTQATVVGFGTTESNVLSEKLRSSNTVVQNDLACLAYDAPLYGSLLNEFTFCAGYGPQYDINPRNGDSGGGLIIPSIQADHRISWFLRGVLSKCGVPKGHIDCDPRFYTVYTDVGPHYGWIYHHSGLQFHSNILYRQ